MPNRRPLVFDDTLKHKSEVKDTDPLLFTEIADYVSGTSAQTRTSTAFALLDSMTRTPSTAGTYEITFNCDASLTGVNGHGRWQVYIDGVAVGDSVRDLQCSTAILGLVTLSTNWIQAPITIKTKGSVNGSQAIEVRWRSVDGSQINVNARSLTVRRIAT